MTAHTPTCSAGTEDRADTRAFERRCEDDRHHFRFIIAPEDGAELTDLKVFNPDLLAQMEQDLGTGLISSPSRIGTPTNPHVRLLVRGVAQNGTDLVIARDYISHGPSHGPRSRAEELASIELGPEPEHEVRARGQCRALDPSRCRDTIGG